MQIYSHSTKGKGFCDKVKEKRGEIPRQAAKAKSVLLPLRPGKIQVTFRPISFRNQNGVTLGMHGDRWPQAVGEGIRYFFHLTIDPIETKQTVNSNAAPSPN